MKYKNYFNQCPSTFPQAQAAKRKPECDKCTPGGENLNLGSQNGRNWHFWGRQDLIKTEKPCSGV